MDNAYEHSVSYLSIYVYIYMYIVYMCVYPKSNHINFIFTLNLHIKEKNENKFSYHSQSIWKKNTL